METAGVQGLYICPLMTNCFVLTLCSFFAVTICFNDVTTFLVRRTFFPFS